jgi:glycosyltransferase involved in cell wall biosynthesis
VYRIYHGLSDDFARLLGASPPPERRFGGELRVLGVGRLVPKKGFDVLLEACGRLLRQGLDLDMVLVGEDDEHAPLLRRTIAALRLDERVRLTGPLLQPALYREYLRASVFCLPCRILADGDRDGIPNVLPEAMACGLPVVTTPISGIPELVADGVNGLTVPPEDPEALARAILRLHQEPGLAARLSRAARTTVQQRFDGGRSAAELAALLRSGGTA